MYSNDALLKLIELVYSASLEPAQWTQVLNELQRVTGASGADLSSFALDRPWVNFSHGVGIVDDAFKREYTPLMTSDPWVRRMSDRGIDGFRGGTIGIGEDLVPTTVLKGTEFYNEFGRHWGYTGGLTAIIAGDGVTGSALNLCRRENQIFGTAERRLMRALMPHLQRALQVHHRLATADAATHASLSALERSTIALLLLDARGEICHATAAAAALLLEGDGLEVRGRAIRATHHVQNVALQEAIASAIDASAGCGFGSGGRLTLARRSGKRPLQLVVSPWSSKSAVFTESVVGAVVVIADLGRVAVAPETEVRRAFGLTPAEARLAVALADGLSISEAAQRLSTTPGSLRTRLKTVFAKTGTHRQSELVRLILTLPC